jgi:hypothetical protein
MKTIMFDREHLAWVVVPDVEYMESLEFYDDERGCWFSPYTPEPGCEPDCG